MAKRILEIEMHQCIHLLGISKDGYVDVSAQDVQENPTSVSAICPNCGGQHISKRRTLNLNAEGNVFACGRCGFSGGLYDLIAFCKQWPRNEVKAKIMAGELVSKETLATQTQNNASTRCTIQMADIHTRDATYRGLLDMLSLTEAHKKELMEVRGLDEDAIKRIGFKSIPLFLDGDFTAKKLLARGCELKGVPGFGLGKNRQWTLSRIGSSGYLIPIYNVSGLIQGFQIRHDNPSDSIPKYSYMTSAKMESGVGCSTWCGWCGSLKEEWGPEGITEFILTEGPLKASIIRHISGKNVMAVPGVSALSHVPEAIISMREMAGLKTVYIAYDMDLFTNPAVLKQLNRLKAILDQEHIQHKTLTWDDSFKGLDDWLLNERKKGNL